MEQMRFGKQIGLALELLACRRFNIGFTRLSFTGEIIASNRQTYTEQVVQGDSE